jgi:hypothetical protein
MTYVTDFVGAVVSHRRTKYGARCILDGVKTDLCWLRSFCLDSVRANSSWTRTILLRHGTLGKFDTTSVKYLGYKLLKLLITSDTSAYSEDNGLQLARAMRLMTSTVLISRT